MFDAPPHCPLSLYLCGRYLEWSGGAWPAHLIHDMSTATLTFYSEIGGLKRTAPLGLLAQARRGDPEAFAEMASPYMSTVYQRARRLTGNPADAEDVSQEALLKAWSRLEQFSGSEEESGNDFRAWISRIGANSSIDLLRQRRDAKMVSLEERRSPDEDTLGSGIAAREDNPEERCARREMGRILADAIVRLPPDLRRVCLLRDVLRYSTQEVAERLGVSIVAVRLRLFRAHRRLRENLEEALRPKIRRAEQSAREARTPTRAPARSRESFLPLGAAAGYACGD
jgi:RNA polymerase sigma-70 factor (ECF subfamily)